MSHNIDKTQIHKRLNLYTIHTEKFKTDLIGVYIKRRLTPKEAAYNTLISRILTRGTKKYPSGKILQNKLDDSYGMILVSDVVKQGSYHILEFRLQFPNQKHLMDTGLFDEALDLLHQVIFNPLADEQGFLEDIFNQEKNNLMDELEGRQNDKMSYALDRCIEHMYDHEGYGQYVYGDLKTIEGITRQDLYDHYKTVILGSLFDICIMGDLRKRPVRSSVEKHFSIEENDYLHYEVEENDPIHMIPRTVMENDQIQEGKMVMGFRTLVDYKDPLYEASVLAYHILGGGPSSELFHVLRDEHSLCYYVYAKSDKYKGALFIGAGIEPKDLDRVTDLVFQVIEDLRVRLVDQAVLDDTIKGMVDSIHALSDFSNSFLNFLYGELLGKDEDHLVDINEIINGYKRVRVEDLQEVFKRLHPEMIYMLHGGQDEIL